MIELYSPPSFAGYWADLCFCTGRRKTKREGRGRSGR